MASQKTCVILGAGPGVGFATARRFAREGYAIVLAARRVTAIQPLVEDLVAQGFSASAVSVDCSSEASIRQVIAACGSVDVLLYNAAGVTMAAPSIITPDQLDHDLRVSITGALVAAQAAATSMRDTGTGTMLFTGGGFALRPMASLVSLGVGKAGLRNLVFSLTEEFKPAGIRVGTVTIMGTVAPSTAFDPTLIAESFYSLHLDRQYGLGVEISFTGSSQT